MSHMYVHILQDFSSLPAWNLKCSKNLKPVLQYQLRYILKRKKLLKYYLWNGEFLHITIDIYLILESLHFTDACNPVIASDTDSANFAKMQAHLKPRTFCRHFFKNWSFFRSLFYFYIDCIRYHIFSSNISSTLLKLVSCHAQKEF